MALISPRRLGKTNLIHHCFNQLGNKGHYYTFIIDIYATSSLRDFVDMFGKAILRRTEASRKEGLGDVVTALKLCSRNDVRYEWCACMGHRAWEHGEPAITLDEIFSYQYSESLAWWP